MATTKDAAQKALEEFDNRARELWKRAELDKKRAKKRAKPTPKPRPKKVVVEQKDHAPTKEVEELTLAERDELLAYLNNALTKKDFVPIAKRSIIKETVQRVLDSMTAEQVEKMRSVFTPAQFERLNEFWESLQRSA